MNIKDLEYLVALAEHKHFKNAATYCHVSQPTLSGQIKKLEDELGLLLLERTSRRVLFTENGLLLVNQAQTILNEIKTFKDMARNQGREMEGPLSVGVIPTVGPYIIPSCLNQIKQQYPHLKLSVHELQTSEIIEKLLSGKLDCAILANDQQVKGFSFRPLYTESLVLVVNKQSKFAKLNSIEMKDLVDEELLLLEKGHCLRTNVLEYCSNFGIREKTDLKAASIEMIKNMIEANLGIALLPKLVMLNGIIQSKNMVQIKVVNPEPMREIVLIYRPGSPLKIRYEKLAQLTAKVFNDILVNKEK